MASDPIITREIAPLPDRAEDAHKGEVGRIVVIGGCCGDVAMVGAPAMVANAAFRSGCGLVQLLVPKDIRTSAAVLARCATTRTLPSDAAAVLQAVREFRADVVALGPGLGDSLSSEAVAEVLNGCEVPMVVDADGLNQIAAVQASSIKEPQRVVMTPHPGEMRRLLSARNIQCQLDSTNAARWTAACALVEAYGCIAVLKGPGTIVTNGQRLYVNETGNAGMATGGTGDVLTGIIAALIGQKLPPFEAAILGVYLHGLAGDFAAEELGRWSMTATDVIAYLPEAFNEHAIAAAE